MTDCTSHSMLQIDYARRNAFKAALKQSDEGQALGEVTPVEGCPNCKTLRVERADGESVEIQIATPAWALLTRSTWI